ncbi:hypothetical protein Peur_017432 [Populus x canadensis]
MDRVLSAEIANPTGPRMYTQDEVHQSANYLLLWKEMNAPPVLWRCSTLPSRASSTPATSTWLEKENSIIPTDQILNESLQSKTETRHEVIGSELKKATYNLLLRNKWTMAPRKSSREVCNSFWLNLTPIDINYLPKPSLKSYETWVKGPKPLDLWYGRMPCGPGSRSKSHGLRTLIRIQGSGR